MTIVVTPNGNTRIRTDICECHLCFAFFNPPLLLALLLIFPKNSQITLFILYFVCFIIFAMQQQHNFPPPLMKKKNFFWFTLQHPWYTFYFVLLLLFVPSFISIEWHVLQVWRNLCVSFNLITQFPFFPSLQSNDTFLSFSILYIIC